MKLAEIIIRPSMYYETKEKLKENGFNAVTNKDVLGRGKKSGEFTVNDSSNAPAIGIEFVAKKLIEIYVFDEDLERLIDVVLKVNSNGCAGDGKIFISNVEEVIRVRTGQRGLDAIM